MVCTDGFFAEKPSVHTVSYTLLTWCASFLRAASHLHSQIHSKRLANRVAVGRQEKLHMALVRTLYLILGFMHTFDDACVIY